jgi:hypothetical protein
MATVLNVASRLFNAGTFTSSNFTIPLGVNSVTVTFTLATADVTNTANTMTFSVNRSNGAGGWIFDNGFTWQGGPNNPRTGLPKNPTITVDVGPLAGQTCQVVVVLNNAITSSILVTTA